MKHVQVFACISLFLLGSCHEKKDVTSTKEKYTQKGADFFGDSLGEEQPKTSKPKSTIKKPDYPQEIKSYTSFDVQERDLFLAATKLCWNYDYTSVFGDFRKGNRKNGKEHIIIDNCCAALVPSPYVSPFEYYFSTYHSYNEITNYQNNVFKLREIRQKLIADKFGPFKEKVLKTNTEDLVSYTFTSSTIQGYDFDTGQLNISYRIKNNQRIGRSGTMAKVKSLGRRYSSSFTHALDMTEDRAKEIYDHYAAIDEYRSRKNPPFNLTTKTTYSLKIPEVAYRPYAFEIVLKKIEFYTQNEGYPSESDKLAEIQFINDQKVKP